MGRPYASELAELPSTYRRIALMPQADFAPVQQLSRDLLRASSVVFVASGGAIVLAELAAREHAFRTGKPALALTPLQLVAAPDAAGTLNSAVVLFSARARHPDVKVALRAARRADSQSITLVTQLTPADLDAEISSLADRIVTLPKTTPDGFLATNSLLAMATAWIRGSGGSLPSSLPSFADSLPQLDSPQRLLIAYDPDFRPVAVDLETRLSECGLADVQVTDLRNLAHGRHVGLLNRTSTTAMVVVFGPRFESLAGRTSDVLPKTVEIIQLKTGLAGSAGVLDALVRGMHLVGDLARNIGADPGRPKVSPEGRRLYHLSWERVLPATPPGGSLPARRKAAAAGVLPGDQASNDMWDCHYLKWLPHLLDASFKAVLLDYDGTCCATDARREPPQAQIQTRILEFLAAGISIGFASGRGPSLPEALREWIPARHWDKVVVGLYNGGIVRPLTHHFQRRHGCTDQLKKAADMLDELLPSSWVVERRPHQVTVQAHEDDFATHPSKLVRTYLARDPSSTLKIVSSGHSVDIVPAGATKVNVLKEMRTPIHEVLIIGDQGEPGGNDFELLAASPMSLSVDRISADPERCWNIGDSREKGPELLQRYLQAIDIQKDRAIFSWSPKT